MTSSSILLGVNIDHSATVRQARYRGRDTGSDKMVEPDPVAIALLAIKAGADAITLHLREDRRHIQEDDVYRMRTAIGSTRMNFEMAATPAMQAIALKIQPAVILLVPENREEVTTEGGLDVIANHERIRSIISAVQSSGIETSLFVDPDPQQIAAAAAAGANCVELHTGAYANACYASDASRQSELEKLKHGSTAAHERGLRVNAGHGINYENVSAVVQLPWLHELNIGHSIISRALSVGIEQAVKEMKQHLTASK